MKRAALRVPPTGLSALAALVLLLVAFAFAPTASAHADLAGTDPEDGAVLAEVPTEITLSFGEELLPESVQVSVGDGTGLVVRVAQPVVEGADVTVTTPPGLTPPDFTVNYRVVSQDGHPVSGTFSFTAGSAPAPASASAAASTAPSPAASAAASPVASAVADTTDAAGSESTSAESSSSESSTNVVPIVAIALGLAIGIAIGALFIWRRRGAPTP